MPEMRFKVRWPDGSEESCYSPSLIIKEYFEVGKTYSLADFLKRSQESLTIASERVYQKFGFYCTGATDQLSRIESKSDHFQDHEAPEVEILSFIE